MNVPWLSKNNVPTTTCAGIFKEASKLLEKKNKEEKQTKEGKVFEEFGRNAAYNLNRWRTEEGNRNSSMLLPFLSNLMEGHPAAVPVSNASVSRLTGVSTSTARNAREFNPDELFEERRYEKNVTREVTPKAVVEFLLADFDEHTTCKSGIVGVL
jgi:hypothetical protein